MPTAFAIAAHPDDIEFVMAGTLLRLQQAGWDIHCMNLSSGNLGSTVMDSATTAATRLEEARKAARILGARWHPPISNDLDIFYDRNHLRKLGAVVREVNPAIVLTHAPADYMEDHMNTSRLAVTAVFARGIPNFPAEPPTPPVGGDCAVYHAQPHMNSDPLGQPVRPTHFVDVTGVQETKLAALACHRSQKEWLDKTQGMNSYLATMEQLTGEVGKMSGRFAIAEGWRQHLFVAFCARGADPLREALGDHCLVEPPAPVLG